MTTKTIGTGGDYSDLASWRAACPADLVSTTQTWRGELKNQNFAITAGLTFAGVTTNSSYYVELTTEAGASFADNANKLTNALRYNASNGASISSGTAWVDVFTSGGALVKVSKLQISTTHNNSDIAITTSTGSFQFDQCILETKSSTSVGAVTLYNSGRISNSLIVNRRSSSPGPCIKGTGWAAYNCTLAATAAAGANAIYTTDSSATLKNCALFNYTAAHTGGGTPTYSYCGTDIASPPSGCTGSLTYASQFESVTDGSHDFRLKAGNSLANAGTTESTYAASDIIGTSRPQGAAYDIGCWEAAAAGGAGIGPFNPPMSMSRMGGNFQG